MSAFNVKPERQSTKQLGALAASLRTLRIGFTAASRAVSLLTRRTLLYSTHASNGTKEGMNIHYSNGAVITDAVICIWNDAHTERRGNWYRAYWCSSPDADCGSPVIGYCSPGGSQPTVRAAMLEALRYHPGECVYRNGRLISTATATNNDGHESGVA